jgi:SAM-dependent methyltransferase
MAARYFPEIFHAADALSARDIILTNEGPGADTETRWACETPYVLDLLRGQMPLAPDSLILDYGCGIGRMAKAMIDATGCSVIGLDVSPSMRALAVDYVASDRFVAVSPGQFDRLVQAGLLVDATIAIWVLQHRNRRGIPGGGCNSGVRLAAWACCQISCLLARIHRAAFSKLTPHTPEFLPFGE